MIDNFLICIVIGISSHSAMDSPHDQISKVSRTTIGCHRYNQGRERYEGSTFRKRKGAYSGERRNIYQI